MLAIAELADLVIYEVREYFSKSGNFSVISYIFINRLYPCFQISKS